MAQKLCKDCGIEPKKPGHPLYCIECWLYRQPLETQTAWMKRRQAAVPKSLRRQRVPERQWPPGRRWCSGCWSFPRLRDCSGSRCRTCASLAKHSSHLERTYVIDGRPFTADDFAALERAQGGRCAICGRKSRSKRLTVDHDHASNEVRGLVCGGRADEGAWSCNWSILASLDSLDDPLAAARRLVAYYEGPPAQRLLSRT